MAERLDVLVVTKYQQNGEEKSRFSRCGAAFSTKNGGWSLKFDGPVVIVPGVNDLVMFPPKPKDGQGDGGSGIPF